MATMVFQYTNLFIKLSEAKKLASREMSGLRDPFCIVKVDNEAIARTATAFKTLEPFWGEEYSLHVPNDFQDISVLVYDSDTLGSKAPLGKVMLAKETIVKSPKGVDKWFPLTPISRDDAVQGEILVEISLEQFGEDVIKIMVTIVEARDLAGRGGKSDPVAIVYYNKEQYSTQVAQKTRFPRWKKSFDITAPDQMESEEQRVLKVVVFDWEKLSANHFMGQVEVDLSEMQIGQRYKTWYRLQHNDEQKLKEKKKELGSLRLKVQCHEERILDSNLYSPFVEIMLKAVEDPKPEGSPLLVMLEEVMTMDRNTMGQTLVRFYLAHGSVLPFLDTLTMREIHQSTDTRTLFRGNSLASKSFDQFMKIVALPYLHETLSSSINMIYTDHKLCELDIEQLKQAARVKSDSVALKTVETSIATLSGYAQHIMEQIFTSVYHCPSLLRMALRQLWLRVAEKFKDPDQTDVPFLAITGFLFLRLFVPAILSPKLFALREEHSDQRSERTLKLLAKVMQNVGNLSTEMEAKKEPFMAQMSFILPEGVRRLKEFILELVQIDQRNVTAETGVKDGGYIHHLILCRGWLWKRSSTSSGVASNLQYRKRFFELSNIALTYAQNEKKSGEVKSYPVQWIKVVEKLDESAFNRKYMLQVVIVPTKPTMIPDLPSQISLYLQAADVNEQNKWVSAIKKACLTNRDMSPVYHPGAFKKTKWSCCRTTASQEPGCSYCHRGITIGDWKDPLDPELDAQVIFSQFNQGKSSLLKKYLPAGDDGSGSMNNGSMSPTSLSSSGATSLQQDDDGVSTATGGSAGVQTELEASCKEVLSIVEELAWHHSQIHA